MGLSQRIPVKKLGKNAGERNGALRTTEETIPVSTSWPSTQATKMATAGSGPLRRKLLWIAVVGDGGGFSVELCYLDGERFVVREGFIAEIA